MTTPEERIKAAAEALASFNAHGHLAPAEYTARARKALAAAYPEDFASKPKWPTDESAIAYCEAMGLDIEGGEASTIHRDGLRAAFLADLIIKAAVAHRRAAEGGWSHYHCPVCEAVDEAGL